MVIFSEKINEKSLEIQSQFLIYVFSFKNFKNFAQKIFYRWQFILDFMRCNNVSLVRDSWVCIAVKINIQSVDVIVQFAFVSYGKVPIFFRLWIQRVVLLLIFFGNYFWSHILCRSNLLFAVGFRYPNVFISLVKQILWSTNFKFDEPTSSYHSIIINLEMKGLCKKYFSFLSEKTFRQEMKVEFSRVCH